MKAAVQLLARQGVDAETAEALNREITRVEGLVRRLVNFARPLAPRGEVTTVESLLDGAVEAAHPALARHNITVQRRAEAGLPPVEVDPLLVTQALVNLLTNAAEAMAGDGGGAVELSAGRALVLGRDEIAIRVADRGPGLSDGDARELFKPFFTTKRDGHGLGLAISQNILLEHGGRIVARNRPHEEGHGAVFEVQLPILR
jgi:signal transduction histidine kinase